MRHCVHCGAGLEPGDRFCPDCGAAIDQSRAATGAVPVRAAAAPAGTSRGSGIRKPVVISLIALACVAVIAAAVVLVVRSMTSPENVIAAVAERYEGVWVSKDLGLQITIDSRDGGAYATIDTRDEGSATIELTGGRLTIRGAGDAYSASFTDDSLRVEGNGESVVFERRPLPEGE